MLWLFWCSVGCLAGTYIVFPAVLVAAAWLVRRAGNGEPPGSPLADLPSLPSLTVIFSFVAEGSGESGLDPETAASVRRRVADILACGYPRERLRIVAVGDGATAGVEGLQAEFEAQGEPVLVLALAVRRGKTAAQNLAVRHAAGDVLVFTDADTRFLPGALEAVVRPLRHPDVGCVSGRLTYEGASMEGLYWRYEMALKQAESRLHSLIGANGALYALRRADYAELPDWALSDLVEPLYQLFEGRRTALALDAVAVEAVGLQPGEAFRRKRRITLRALGSLLLVMPALDVMRRPLTALLFVAHKLLRWFSWLPALGLAVSSAALSSQPPYGWAAAAQAAFYGYGAGARLGLPGAALPAYIVEVVVAQLAAGVDWVAGRRLVTWPPSSAAPSGRRRRS
jgi:hypothetical protein